MRKLLGVVVCGAALLLGMPATPLRAAKVVDRIIARVNNEIITMRQFQQEREKLRQTLGEQFSGQELEVQFREQSKDLLSQLIDQALLVQKAKDLDINVETDLIKRLDDIRKENNLPDLDALEKEVEKTGLNWEDFKDQIRRNLLVREVIGREVGSRIMISRDDARKFYEQHKEEFKSAGMVHLAEILVSSDKHKGDEAKKRADEALAEVKAGQKFSDIVKKYSDGPGIDQGGDIGFVKAGTMAPAIAAAVNKLDINETSDIIPIKDGYVIYKVMERFSPGIPKFEEVEQRINEALYDQKMKPKMREYLVQLRKESYIFLAPGFLDTGAERPSETELAKKGQ